jgi:hypothetical protein
MRSAILLLILVWLAGCASGKPSEDDYLVRTGVIVGKEVVELEEGSGKSKVNTSVSASVSSGSGVSIGLGVLLGSLSRGSADKPPVRYRVDLNGGEQITVYHESDVFEAGDCVEIRSLPGDDKSLPKMKRLSEGCE